MQISLFRWTGRLVIWSEIKHKWRKISLKFWSSFIRNIITWRSRNRNYYNLYERRLYRLDVRVRGRMFNMDVVRYTSRTASPDVLAELMLVRSYKVYLCSWMSSKQIHYNDNADEVHDINAREVGKAWKKILRVMIRKM